MYLKWKQFIVGGECILAQNLILYMWFYRNVKLNCSTNVEVNGDVNARSCTERPVLGGLRKTDDNWNAKGKCRTENVQLEH